MPTQTTAMRYRPQFLRRRADVITVLDPTVSPSPSTNTNADNTKMKELVSDDESKDNGFPETSEATPTQTSPVGFSQVLARVFAFQKDPPDSAPWYQPNFPILVTVVSHLESWLTGTEYIEIFFMVVFVLFYLHQLIETPWQVYINSRPDMHPLDISPSIHSPSDNDARIAASQLRPREAFFLFFTPFIGVFFFDYATTVVLGPGSISLSDATLFVFAASLRPWSHLLHHLQQDAINLQNATHHSSPDLLSTATDSDAYGRIKTLDTRMAHVERAMVKMKAPRVTNAPTTNQKL